MWKSISYHHSPRVKDERDKPPTDWFGNLLLTCIGVIAFYILAVFYF